MKQDHKKCWSCGSFKAYYTRGFCCLLKENTGYCHQHSKIMEKSGSCDKWYCRRTSRERRIKIAVRCIPEIYNKVAVLEQILTDESELEKIKTETDDKRGGD